MGAEVKTPFNWNLVRLNPDSPLPYYEQLAAFLRRKIDAGELAPGEKLPSYEALQQYFHLSSNSVRNGVRLLVRDGYLVRHPRIGSYVTGRIVTEADSGQQLPPLLCVITGAPPFGKPLKFHTTLLDCCHAFFAPRKWRINWRFPREGEGMYYLCRKTLDEDQPQAVLLAGFTCTRSITSLFLSAGIPLVSIGTPEDQRQVPFVCNDHYTGMKTTVEKLLSLGHQNILLLDCNSGNYAICQERRRGYIHAYSERGLVPDARLLVQLCHNTESPQEFLQEMNQLRKYPLVCTAIIVYGRNLLHFVLNDLKSHHRRIPEDVSVFVYEANDVEPFFDRACWDIGLLVENAAQMLLAGNHVPMGKFFPVKFEEGHSIRAFKDATPNFQKHGQT